MKYRLFIILTLLTTFAGCYFWSPAILSPECRKFFDLPLREQEQLFRTYSVDKQVDLYLCGMNREPPETAYAAYIAEGGEKNIPYLLQRLKAERLEMVQTEIIDIFTVMAIKGQLRGREDVIAELEEVVAKMKYGPVKLIAQKYLEDIKKTHNVFRISAEVDATTSCVLVLTL